MFDHFIRHLANGGAKITTRPKMSSPVPLLQVRKLLEQIARSPSLNAPHDFAARHIRRGTHQNMNMIFAHYAFDDPYLKRFAGFGAPSLLLALLFRRSALYNDTWLPKQNGTQFDKPYDGKLIRFDSVYHYNVHAAIESIIQSGLPQFHTPLI
jgi:hypothetical protein